MSIQNVFQKNNYLPILIYLVQNLLNKLKRPIVKNPIAILFLP
ncbi:MAG: hypothetical protein ACI8ZX_000611 [Planctomycetota bacterium]